MNSTRQLERTPAVDRATEGTSPTVPASSGTRPAQPGVTLVSTAIPPSVVDQVSIRHSGLRVEKSMIVSIGGGLGSFVLADTLRVAGLPTADLRVISTEATPIDTYEHRVANSGITPEDRLRSDSCSTLDNLWGFPGYALREVIRERRPGPALRVMTEPLIADYYTPRAGEVYRSVRSEATRIGWADMLRQGRAEWVRPHRDGGYVTCYTAHDGERKLLQTMFVHLACGAGPLRVPADSEEFRRRNPENRQVRHVYEPEVELPAQRNGQPLVVAVRGSGIAAAHAVDCLLARQECEGTDLRVVHIERPRSARSLSEAAAGSGTKQAFNVPKAAWGGQLHHRLRASDEEDQVRLLRELTETNSPSRRLQTKRLRRAIELAVYRKIVAEIDAIDSLDGSLVLQLDGEGEDDLLICDRLIDATGLRSGVSQFPVVADFLEACSVEPTHFDRVQIGPSFAASGMESGRGEVYISGSLAFGRQYGAPDTFLGLQFAAMAIHDDLAQRAVAPRLSTRRSMAGWLKWIRRSNP